MKISTAYFFYFIRTIKSAFLCKYTIATATYTKNAENAEIFSCENVTLYAANIVILKIIWPLENIKYSQMTTLFLQKNIWT